MTEPTQHGRDRHVHRPTPYDPAEGPAPVPLGDGTVVLVLTGADREWAGRAVVGICSTWARAGRRVVLADMHFDSPLLDGLLGFDGMQGVVDLFLYGASVGRTARPVPGEDFYVIPVGTYEPDAAIVYENARWPKLVAGFRDASATLVLFAPADSVGIPAIARWVDECIILGAGEPALLDDLAVYGIAPEARLIPPTGDELPTIADFSSIVGDEETAPSEPADALDAQQTPVDGVGQVLPEEASLPPGEMSGTDVPSETFDPEPWAATPVTPESEELEPEQESKPEPEPEPTPPVDSTLAGEDDWRADPGLDADLLSGGGFDAFGLPDAAPGGSDTSAAGRDEPPTPAVDSAAQEPRPSAEPWMSDGDSVAEEPAAAPEPWLLEGDSVVEEPEPDAEPWLLGGDSAAEEPEGATEPWVPGTAEELEASAASGEMDIDRTDTGASSAGTESAGAPSMNGLSTDRADEQVPQVGHPGPENSVRKHGGGIGPYLPAILIIVLAAFVFAVVGFLIARQRPDLIPWGTRGEGANRVGSSSVTRDGPLAVATDASRTGSALPYSVTGWAFMTMEAAAEHAERERARFTAAPIFVSPEEIQGVLYYKVLAGSVADTAAASRLRTELIAAGMVEPTESIIQFSPLAFDLGEFVSRDSASARIDSLAVRDVPAYMISIPYSDGTRRWQLYGGAYRDSMSAEAMRQQLQESGVASRLVARIGEAAAVR